MDDIQKIVAQTLKDLPRLALERRLAFRAEEVGISVEASTLKRAAEHILSGSRGNFRISDDGEDVTIQITAEDLEWVMEKVDHFFKDELAGVLAKSADDIAVVMYNSLSKKWPEEFQAQEADMAAFRSRLEHRWGKGLAKLRMLLTIVREWAQGVHDSRHKKNGGKVSHYEDVMLRLHVRACQVMNEIIVLLENGYADGAVARWRTLHEIATVAAVIAKFGDDIAERYVYYQIVESYQALKAYERNHQALGYGPPTRKHAAKVRNDYANVLKRFGKKFGEENGWAAHHLNAKEKERITFARLEEEIGDTYMRSPYKMASYNVHASPKGVYFKIGSLDGPPVLLSGASNAGLVEPAQHAAFTFAEITDLVIGDTLVLDDLVVRKIVSRLEHEIPQEFAKAHDKLRRDDRRYRRSTQTQQSSCG